MNKKLRLLLRAFRIALTSRMPEITFTYRRWRKSNNSFAVGDDHLTLFRSKDCRLQRNKMASQRQKEECLFFQPPSIGSTLSSNLPVITICLVLYNSERWIYKWVKSIAELDYPRDKIKLSVVDNNSTDQSSTLFWDTLSEFNLTSCVLSFKNSENVGFGNGQNLAISNADTEYIIICNPDAFFLPDSISNAITFAVNDSDEICSWEFAQIPFEHPKYYDPVTLETSWNSHAAVLFKSRCISEVGGYDQNIFLYGEDVDLSYRLRLSGYRLRYLPNARVVHDTMSRDHIRNHHRHRSIAANLCLRRRFGRLTDRISGIFLIMASTLQSSQIRTEIIGPSFMLYFRMRKYFRPLRSKNKYFPFNGFNYERRRCGVATAIPLPPPNKPKVSVITRVHKHSSVLSEAINCVRNQTYEHLEHIIVYDNCDPLDVPGTISVHVNFSNPSSAGNAGAKAASGRYILFLDYDDLIFADHIEGLCGTLSNSPDAVTAYSYSWEAMTSNRIAGTDQRMIQQLNMEPWYDEKKLHTLNFFAIQSVLICKDAFDGVGGFDGALTYQEDWDLWKKLARRGEFKAYRKTTSIYHTPSNVFERTKRIFKHIKQ